MRCATCCRWPFAYMQILTHCVCESCPLLTPSHRIVHKRSRSNFHPVRNFYFSIKRNDKAGYPRNEERGMEREVRDGTRPVHLSWRVTVDRSVALRQSIQLRGTAGDVGRETKGSSVRSLFFNRGHPSFPRFPPFEICPWGRSVTVDALEMKKKMRVSRKLSDDSLKFDASYKSF